MKMQKKSVLLAAFLLMGATAYAEETEAVGTEALGTEAEGSQSTEALSDKWSDYQIQIDGQIYQFPMMYDAFSAYGWTSKDVDGVELEPNEYGLFRFEKDNVKCTVYILNLGMNTMAAEECIVGGMSIDSYDWELGTSTIILPGGIVRGQADGAAIEAAYGTPSDTYEGELYKEYTYETDYNSSLEMKVYKESGVLEEIEIENFVEPEGFEPGEASDEVPEAVAAYSKPETLSENVEDYQIQLDGQVYAMPVPVSVLAADGWEIDESQSDEFIKAGYFGWVTLRKGGQEIRETVVNPENYATVPANCWVEELEVGGYSLEAEGVLPGGISIGMPEQDFLAVLDGAGMDYEVEEHDDYTYYTYNKKDYSQCFQVMVYTGEDGYFDKDCIMEVTCENTVE